MSCHNTGKKKEESCDGEVKKDKKCEATKPPPLPCGVAPPPPPPPEPPKPIPPLVAFSQPSKECKKPVPPPPPSPTSSPHCEKKPDPPKPPPCAEKKPEPPKPPCETKPQCPPQPAAAEPPKCGSPPPEHPRSICDPPLLKCETEAPTDAVTPQNTEQTKPSNAKAPQAQAALGANGQRTNGCSKPEEPKCTCGPPPEKCPENSKNNDMPTIPLKEARRFMYDCFVAAGASPEHASLHADMMIFADTRGVFGHGMARLETTCCNLKNKKICGKSIPEILNESPCIAYIDGKHALGAVVGCYCMDLAIKKAKICGLGFVNCKNATPFGYATFYADRATKNGLIGMAISNQPPTVIPTRAMEPAIGANQVALAAPISICDSANIDFSAAVGSMGKVEMFSKMKAQLPSGWAQVEGKPTTDPALVLEKGGLLPLGGTSEDCGGHKGFCLGLMLETITGMLSGSDFGPKLSKDKDHHFLSHTYVAINPEMFAGGFADRLKWFSHTIRNMPPYKPGKCVLMPGDVERKFADQVDMDGGIKYLKAQMGQCQRVADEFKVKHLGEAKPNV
ncbi:uncharacterized oxidoreductase YjmC-like isoform X2 [Chrysoperla carnea]|uniref:uncharacterized oxidoreductase YjmC-like isoform X2 n=1 Tax=Chrysoperla carnea TaxID=189513 RepID=UPI001D0776ED|nr:uncharacterized oxidoreductase YjmC-like isoform X2 [Chrysoperla carnea]